MKYIKAVPSPNGAYPAPQSTPFPGAVALTDEQAATLIQYNGFVAISDTDGQLTITPNTEAWEAWKATLPEPEDPIIALKSAKIAESKIALADYLAAHPLIWTDGKPYSVTQEKQSLLMGNIAAYQIEVQSNPEAVVTWNASGEECVPWDINELCALAVAIKNYVKPLVSYQQSTEVVINACETVEAVEAIVIDYATVYPDG